MFKKLIIPVLIIAGLIIASTVPSMQNPPITKALTYPDSTGTSNSIRIPSGLFPVGLFSIDSLDNDSANVKFEVSYGNRSDRIWYTVFGADTTIQDSNYYTLHDMFKSLEGTAGSEVEVWLRSKTDSLQDGDRGINIRFGDTK
jgi:hypothetical protein